MTPTPEELAAFADGELADERAAEVAAMVAADPELARVVERHRRLRQQLGTHFAPISEQPVPDSLVAAVKAAADAARQSEAEPETQVIDFAAARQRREARRTLPRWSYLVAPAAAAALALVLFVPRGANGPQTGMSTQLAAALDSQLVADQSTDASTRILLSFEDKAGQYCRVFQSAAQSGIACHGSSGWQLVGTGSGAKISGTQFAQAGEADAKLLARAQEMAAGPALDPQQEKAARANGWTVP